MVQSGCWALGPSPRNTPVFFRLATHPGGYIQREAPQCGGLCGRHNLNLKPILRWRLPGKPSGNRILLRAGALGDFNYPPGFYTGGADHHLLGTAFVHRAHALQIGVEAPFGDIVSVADIVAHNRFFSAYFTYFRHDIVSCILFRSQDSPAACCPLLKTANDIHIIWVCSCKAFYHSDKIRMLDLI